jgi:E3 ubiquitin-protein ligase UBR1
MTKKPPLVSRRGRPQFLNQKRYDDIVKLWLQHSIPVYVGRKLEATYDCGGWETM